MTMKPPLPITGRRIARNAELARYLHISEMTLWRWQHDALLAFPLGFEVNGKRRTDLDDVDRWTRTRAVSLTAG